MSAEDDQRRLIERLTATLQGQADQIKALTSLVTTFAGASHPAPAARTCDDLLKRWAETKKRLKSFKCDHHRGLFVLDWAPKDGPYAGLRLGARDPLTLTGEDPDGYRVWRYSTTTKRKDHGTGENTPPAPATINRELMMLLRILNFATKRRTIPRNPLRGYEQEDEDNAREVVIEEEGFARILDHIDAPWMRAFVTLGYDSAMRKTELLCCRRSWLDDKRGQVHIPAAIAKNGEKRVADLSPRAWAEIEANPEVLGTDLLFPNPESREPYDGRWVHELFVRAVVASGVVGRDGTPPRLHDLRRSWITLARRRGIPESEIMAKSGHKDHKVFKRYSIVDEADLQRSWQRMEDARQEDLAELAERRKNPQRAAEAQIAGRANLSRGR